MGKYHKDCEPFHFVATEFYSPQQKGVFATWLIRFISTGFPAKKWTKQMYRHLSNCFGFIAHFDQGGFWNEYFADTRGKVAFLKQIRDWRMGGSPTHTFSDVEKVVRNWVEENAVVYKWQRQLDAEIEKIERAELARLSKKYPAP